MATLISWGTSDGQKGRCDARCYNAKFPECQCCCDGANHGKGLTKALKNTQEHAETWIDKLETEHKGLDRDEIIAPAFDESAIFQKEEERERRRAIKEYRYRHGLENQLTLNLKSKGARNERSH